MPLQPGDTAPYTTAQAAITALDAWRDRGFGTPVTPEILTRAGVTESLARRTFQSLVALEVLLPDGQITEQMADFRNTRGDEEYRARLQAWLRSVFADVLQYADPSTDTHERVTEAFRSYEPAGQRRSMAALLLGLWRYAGLPVAATPAPSNGAGQSRAPRRSSAPRKPKPKPPANSGASSGSSSQRLDVGGLPPGLVGLLHQIPSGGRAWTSQRRNDFIQAFQAVLNFSVPVDDNPVTEDSGATEEDDPS